MMQMDSPGSVSKRVKTAAGGHHQETTVTDSGSKTLATTALIFGVASTVLSLLLLLFCLGLWNRFDLLRIYYSDIKTELISRGMNPHPHMPTESP